MTTTPDEPLRDEDMETTGVGGGVSGTATDADGGDADATDADGSDADASDGGTDADGADSDATDG